MNIMDFAFVNPYIPAAFLVAGLLVMFKVQWQAFFYLMVVIYAVNSWPQFALVSFLLIFQILVSQLYTAAAADRK